jgi:hypothetical protein
MKRIVALLVLLLVCTCCAMSQVLSPVEIADPSARRLQQIHFKTLVDIGTEIGNHKFPYPFYLSRVLDVDLSKLAEIDQRSIRFDSYNHQLVLEVTGNYYASYSAQLMDPNSRLRETFQQVIMPVLNAEVPRFPDASEFSSFAIEVSHHLRQKVMGIPSEYPENITFIIPVAAAQRLIDAKTEDQKQAAVLDAEVFLNGQPCALWIKDGGPPEEWKAEHLPARRPGVKTLQASNNSATVSGSPAPTVAANLLSPAPMPVRIISTEFLSALQRENQDTLDRLVTDLNQQAHFLSYSAPSFIAFRQGAYLQLSLSAPLQAASGTSRYKLAALAFDEHISHLIRPILEYFPGEIKFEGIAFSTILRLSDGSSTEAVEFFLRDRMMQCFAAYECTGQQLLDSGTVLINGERAALDLQVAEGKN